MTAIAFKDSTGNTIPVRGQPTGEMFISSGIRVNTTLSIANGASVSNTLDCTYTSILGFVAPAAWTAAALNIEVSADNTNWVTTGLIDGYGAVVGAWVSVTAGAGYSVDAAPMLAWRYIRLRSGTAATPVAQGAQRDFVCVTRPLA